MGQREFKTAIFLIISIFIVHSFYLFFITPISNEILSIASENKTTIPRNIFVILKDIEQEICLILFFWSLMYLIDKQFSYSKLLKGEGKEKLSRSNLDRIFIVLFLSLEVIIAVKKFFFLKNSIVFFTLG